MAVDPASFEAPAGGDARMSTSTCTDLAVPLVHFGSSWGLGNSGFVYVGRPLPKSSMDSRWAACRNHHPACDCREAELGEQIAEYRGEMVIVRRLENWAAAVAELHQKRPNEYVGDRCAECSKPWPCSTWRLTADADFGTSMVEKYYDGQVTR